MSKQGKKLGRAPSFINIQLTLKMQNWKNPSTVNSPYIRKQNMVHAGNIAQNLHNPYVNNARRNKIDNNPRVSFENTESTQKTCKTIGTTPASKPKNNKDALDMVITPANSYLRGVQTQLDDEIKFHLPEQGDASSLSSDSESEPEPPKKKQRYVITN